MVSIMRSTDLPVPRRFVGWHGRSRRTDQTAHQRSDLDKSDFFASISPRSWVCEQRLASERCQMDLLGERVSG